MILPSEAELVYKYRDSIISRTPSALFLVMTHVIVPTSGLSAFTRTRFETLTLIMR